MSIIINILII